MAIDWKRKDPHPPFLQQTAGKQEAIQRMSSSDKYGLDTLDDLSSIYSHPALRLILRFLVPHFGPAIDQSISEALAYMDKRAIKYLISELQDEGFELTEEMSQSHDILHMCSLTVRSVLNTRRMEKIRYFARILASSARDPTTIKDVDEFDEYIGILDDLSYRECAVLATLNRFEREHKIDEVQEPLLITYEYWPAFRQDVKAYIGIPEEELDSMLIRLERTGTYEVYRRTYIGDTSEGRAAAGRTTFVFRKLAEKIRLRADDIS